MRVEARSALWETAALGPGGARAVDQPDHLNAVARLRTTLSARALLERGLQLERAAGRRAAAPGAARPLDVDLLLFGDASIDEPGLTVPHPRLAERAFVLAPLAEVALGAARALLPPAGALAALAAAQGARRLDPAPPGWSDTARR